MASSRNAHNTNQLQCLRMCQSRHCLRAADEDHKLFFIITEVRLELLTTHSLSNNCSVSHYEKLLRRDKLWKHQISNQLRMDQSQLMTRSPPPPYIYSCDPQNGILILLPVKISLQLLGCAASVHKRTIKVDAVERSAVIFYCGFSQL